MLLEACAHCNVQHFIYTSTIEVAGPNCRGDPIFSGDEDTPYESTSKFPYAQSKRLAEELGIHFYDEEILRMTSEESAIGEQYFRLADEKAGNNLLYRVVGGLRDSLGKPSSKNLTSKENLFKFQSEVIRKLAREESCIIVGRCADYILEAEPDVNVIRLFVYADMPTRIRRVMEVDGVLDPDEAVRKIKRIDKERREYYKYFTGREWGDMTLYDLPINTTNLSLDQLADLVKFYIRMRGFEI